MSLSRGPGAGSQFSTDYPAFASAQAAGTLAWCSVLPAPSWAPLSGMGVAGIVGPAWLASLAPFVQSSGHIHWCWRQGLTPDGLCRWG